MFRYKVYRFLVLLVFSFPILLAKHWDFWFGVIVAVSMWGFSWVIDYINTRERAAIHQKHYEEWVAEMNKRANPIEF